MDITISLTEAEYKALAHVAYDPQEWVENFTKERCRKAIDQIVSEVVEKSLENGVPIQGTKEEIVLSSNVKSAKEMTDELDNEEI